MTIKYCCEEFEDAVKGDKFNSNRLYAYDEYNPYHDNRWYCTWVDGCENLDEFAMNYCPFCGVKLND